MTIGQTVMGRNLGDSFLLIPNLFSCIDPKTDAFMDDGSTISIRFIACIECFNFDWKSVVLSIMFK